MKTMFTLSYFDSHYTTTHLFFASTKEIAKSLIARWLDEKIPEYEQLNREYEEAVARHKSAQAAYARAVDRIRRVRDKVLDDPGKLTGKEFSKFYFKSHGIEERLKQNLSRSGPSKESCGISEIMEHYLEGKTRKESLMQCVMIYMSWRWMSL